MLIETQRLLIKPPTQEDFADLLALRTDPDVMKYIGDGSLQSEEKVKTVLTQLIEYYKKYGTTFFCAFEKSSGNFIGQVGLFQLAFDEKQTELEVAYRLHKKYWGFGYATELTRAIISWGFNHLSVDHFVAVIKPNNNASRRVLEKSGMYYLEKTIAYNEEVAKYHIVRNSIDYEKIQLIPASLAEYPIIQNMARFYVYDMSEFMGWDMEKTGLYECISFEKYFDKENNFPFLIKYENELAGFVIVDKVGSDNSIDFNMAQFFILRKFKNKGVARYVAHQCFDKFKGTWEVMVIPGNEGAYRFWRATIKKYTHNNFVEYTKEIVHFENARKNIFKFKCWVECLS